GYYDTSTGLTKFGARYYNPDLARFTQRDPSGKDLPYSYAGSDPINISDPSGHEGFPNFLQGIAIIGAAMVAVALAPPLAGVALAAFAIGSVVVMLAGFGLAMDGVWQCNQGD